MDVEPLGPALQLEEAGAPCGGGRVRSEPWATVPQAGFAQHTAYLGSITLGAGRVLSALSVG